MICVFQAGMFLLFLTILAYTEGRQEGYGGRTGQPVHKRARIRGGGRPGGQYGGRPQQPQGGGFGDLLDGVDLNLLDAKLIGLGYVREDLVQQLCAKGTQALIREGVKR